MRNISNLMEIKNKGLSNLNKKRFKIWEEGVNKKMQQNANMEELGLFNKIDEMSKKEIVEQLEGYRIVIPNPEHYTKKELKSKLIKEIEK